MLKNLYIENIAVIEKATIDFSHGLTVLTGETGAGKSIVIDAINMALGERTSREVIRTGEKQAVVSALFWLEEESSPAAQLLLAEGYEWREVVLERVLAADGRSSCKVNGRPASAAFVRELGSLLLNIHGQHDSQHLLQPERHLEFLDAQAQLGDLPAQYREQYDLAVRIKAELTAVRRAEAEKQRRMELLQHQVRELEQAELVPGEEAALQEKRKLMQHAQRVNEAVTGVLVLLAPDEGEGAVSLLGEASHRLGATGVLSQQLTDLQERAQELAFGAQELAGELSSFLRQLVFDAAEAERLEARASLLNKLRQKYGETAQDMLDALAAAQAELAGYAQTEQRKNSLAQQLASVYNNLQILATELSKRRTEAAARMAQSVEEELAFLDMAGTRFAVQVTPMPQGSFGESGADEVAFLISTNKGEELRPLAKIVSGGELSRIMLALKSIIGHRDGVETLIFDEIDAGVSGSAAEKIGRKLQALAEDGQVLCVTHLSQIACLAHHHLLVEKQVVRDRTATVVQELPEQRRVAELARLISGATITESALAAARDMLRQAASHPGHPQG